MRKFQSISFFTIFTLIILSVTSCRKDEPLYTSLPTEVQNAQIAHDWFDKFRYLTKNCAGFTPPVASRAFGYAGVALYETVVPGMPQHQSLQGQLQGMPKIAAPDLSLEYNWAIATNASMAYIAKKFYANMPNTLYADIQNLENHYNTLVIEKEGVTQSTVERSQKWGQEVARIIFEWSKLDGGHEGYTKNFPTSYKSPVGVGLWVPTFPKFQPALQPFWGSNRSFVTNSTGLSKPAAPIPYSEDTASTFYKEAFLVFKTVKNIKKEEETIARFWSDDPGQPGTPPGHSLSITTQILKKENCNLAKSAEVYAKVGMAVADAFISCWRWKYEYNYMRPISFIRTKFDPTFASLLETPPFPEYTSGHSVQSGATAKVLTETFGASYPFTDATHAGRIDINGTPRSFKSFYDFAAEAAISRLYGGIHYREAIDKGVEQGIKIGAEVTKLKFRKPL
jgi:PAP2 superfamily